MTLGRSLYPPGFGLRQPMTHSPTRFGSKLRNKQGSKMSCGNSKMKQINCWKSKKINLSAQRRALDGERVSAYATEDLVSQAASSIYLQEKEIKDASVLKSEVDGNRRFESLPAIPPAARWFSRAQGRRRICGSTLPSNGKEELKAFTVAQKWAK